MNRNIFLTAAAGVSLAAALTAGCSFNFYAGRTRDMEKIRELSDELARLQRQKEAEADQLREAQAELERRLQQEIRDRQVKLRMAERGLELTFVADVLFDSGKDTLRGQAHETLAKVASVIQEKVSDRDIGIEGHTDNEPIKVSGWRSNWELSTARALSVLHFLEEQGVPPEQMVASGYGEYRPVASNDTAEGRQKNRRVEIIILPKEYTKVERDLIRRGRESGEPELIRRAEELESFK